MISNEIYYLTRRLHKYFEVSVSRYICFDGTNTADVAKILPCPLILSPELTDEEEIEDTAIEVEEGLTISYVFHK